MRFHRFLAPTLLLALPAAATAQVARIYSAPMTRTLRSGGDETRSALGLGVGGSGSARDTLGLLVTSVTPNGPAERAGIQEGDRIAAINGVSLRADPADAGDFDTASGMSRRLTRELSRVAPGDEVDLRVYADGRSRAIRVRTVESDSLYSRRPLARANVDDRATLGIGVAATSSHRDTLGVLVMFVDDAGPAAGAGIEEGNRIAAIDDIDLRAARDDAGDEYNASAKVRQLQREITRLHPGDNVELRVYANGDVRTVRLRTARASDLPRRRGTFIVSGDGLGMTPGAFPLGVDGAFIGEEVRKAIERAMETTGHALEGFGRGLDGSRMRLRDGEMEIPRVEPLEPIHIEPLEPSRLRRTPPSRVPFATVLLDDSAALTPVIAESALLYAPKGGSERAALDIAGLRMVPVGRELSSYLGKGSERGLLIMDVPAWARRVLRPGDVVLAVEGTPARPRDGSDEVTIALPRDREAQLDILRDGVQHSVTLPARR